MATNGPPEGCFFSDDARDATLSRRALERGPIPAAELRGGLVGALKELHQDRARIPSRTDCLVGKEELAELRVEERLRGTDLRPSEALRRWIRIRVERGVLDSAAPGPESRGRDLVAVGLARHRVGEARNASWVPGGRSPGESGHREVEAPPEEVDRARLAQEGRPELLEDAVDLDQRLEEPVHGAGVVGAHRVVLG